MSRSRRSKLSNWAVNYVKLSCHISKSNVSDAHTVYLSISRNQEIKLRRLDSFASIVDAWQSLSQAKAVLAKFKYSGEQSDDEITQRFVGAIHNTFGVLSNDDAVYQMSGDTRAGMEWIAQGSNPFTDIPPPGVHVEIINFPVRKKYNVMVLDSNTDLFTVAQDSDKPLLGEGENILAYSSYVTATYTADYANNNNKDFLSTEEVRQLWYESNLLQGKIDRAKGF